MFLITGAGGGVGSVSLRVVAELRRMDQPVRAMVRRDDARADALRDLGAEVVVGDLTSPEDVARAIRGVTRMFFNMSVSPEYVEASAVVSAVIKELGGVETVVNISQMTVSQMTLTSSEESRQQRLHWLSERVMNWSGIPVVHVRPTVFLDNPLFTVLGAASIRERGALALPFGDGHTSPIAADDVARVVVALLGKPVTTAGEVYELTGPQVLDVAGLAEQFSKALGRAIAPAELPTEAMLGILAGSGLSEHVTQHISTMARLHREDRYNRATDDVERVTGRPAQTVEQWASEHPDLFS
ncbi:hydroxylase [Mycolicibacterium sp. P9-64]|uniref:NmrA family NAD(P)-binding protein n=1 Tax=Mycolicibacterium sp. P9-64 TaxID=2024612 RepID=UPI0011ECD518|nr:NAD(P)H-binding protein [Mycolicibacterium sp. P9-64]KAA0075556.1 hydroxylase [Mycolicibacterium sp. P9-64]